MPVASSTPHRPLPPAPQLETLAVATGELVMEMAQLGADGLPQEIRLLKAGTHNSTKGKFTFDSESAESVMSAAAKHGVQFFFDYGHASLDEFATDPARAGRAAGWYDLQILNGELWTKNLQLTDEAKALLKDRQYRYISPAFRHSNGHVREFVNAAFTNRPATIGQAPVVMSDDVEKPAKGIKMKLVLAALGLPESASEAEALDAVTKLRAVSTGLVTLTATHDSEEAMGALAVLKAAADKLPTVEAELAKLKADAAEEKVQKTVAGAIEAGTLPPSMKERALKMGRKDLEFLSEFLAEQTAIVGKGTAVKPKPPASGPALDPAVEAALEKMAKQMPGVDLAKLKETAAKGYAPPASQD